VVNLKSIICERRIYTDKLNTHSHNYAQLILPLQGILDIETDSKNLKLDEENIFFLPPKCTHTFKSYKTNEFLVLDIPYYMFASDEITKLEGGKEIALDERWKAIRFLILNELTNDMGVSQSIPRLFHYFYQIILEEYSFPSIKYIHKHFDENISIQKLADIEHYTVSYYSEWFKKHMKVSPVEYIQSLRIKRAKELLRSTELNILQIAQEVGYNHHSSLTRKFKELEKITPMEYRQKILK